MCNNPSLIASTPTIPQTPSTLFLASLCASGSQTYSITRVFGIANVDANLTGGAGAQAAFGHCDSNNPVYGMLGSLSANATYNVIFALISV